MVRVGLVRKTIFHWLQACAKLYVKQESLTETAKTLLYFEIPPKIHFKVKLEEEKIKGEIKEIS